MEIDRRVVTVVRVTTERRVIEGVQPNGLRGVSVHAHPTSATEETWLVDVKIDWARVDAMGRKAAFSKGGRCTDGPLTVNLRKLQRTQPAPVKPCWCERELKEETEEGKS